MKTYRFVTTSHHDVIAETVEEAMEAFNEMKRKELSPQFDTVSQIEVEDEEGHYIPVQSNGRDHCLISRTHAHSGPLRSFVRPLNSLHRLRFLHPHENHKRLRSQR